MTESARDIDDLQEAWAGPRARDAGWPTYLKSLNDNLFSGQLHPQTENEFNVGDGGELNDRRGRPAKMRALASSSALAVNFFDAWRDVDKSVLARALGLTPIARIEFEFKTRRYPVAPRSPNLDVMIHLEDGGAVGVESKFSEPFRSDDGHGAMSMRYFAASPPLWEAMQLYGAQELASRLRPEWIHLDAPQLLKHMLGLAHDPVAPGTLLYLWFDTGRRDADAHRKEITRFHTAVADDRVAMRSDTYQSVFRRVQKERSVPDGWVSYMEKRYFPEATAEAQGC